MVHPLPYEEPHGSAGRRSRRPAERSAALRAARGTGTRASTAAAAAVTALAAVLARPWPLLAGALALLAVAFAAVLVEDARSAARAAAARAAEPTGVRRAGSRRPAVQGVVAEAVAIASATAAQVQTEAARLMEPYPEPVEVRVPEQAPPTRADGASPPEQAPA